MSRSYQQTAAVCAICPAHSATSTGSIDLSAALSVEFAVGRLSKEHRQEGLHTLRFKHRLELIKSTERARQEEKHLLTLWPKFTRWRPLDRNRDSNRLSGLNQKFHSNKLCVFNHVCRNAYACGTLRCTCCAFLAISTITHAQTCTLYSNFQGIASIVFGAHLISSETRFLFDFFVAFLQSGSWTRMAECNPIRESMIRPVHWRLSGRAAS